MRTTIPQVFDEVEKAATKESKIKVLRAYDHPIIRNILRMNFDPAIKVYLPEGEPPFKKDTSVPAGYSETNLFAEFRRFYIWLDPNINLTRVRKEQLFVQMLEGIHWTEAELICLAKDKQLDTKYKSLKDALVREAFPDLLPAEVKVPAKIKQPKKKASLGAS
jgi:hypothetical protein